MRVIRLNLGFFELDLRIGWQPRRKQVEIRKYEIIPRDFLPDTERSVLRRLKARFRSQRENSEASYPESSLIRGLNPTPSTGWESCFPLRWPHSHLGKENKRELRTGHLSHHERN